MLDQKAMMQREQVFAEMRETDARLDKLSTERVDIVKSLCNLENNMREIRQNREKLQRLINVMIKYDCCPTEAKLAHSDEIDLSGQSEPLDGDATYVGKSTTMDIRKASW